MKMSQKLIIVVAGLSLGACSTSGEQNTFMTYQNLQDKVREHEEQWQSVQPKLERIDELEAEIAALKQKTATATDIPMPASNSKATMLTEDESMLAANVAPAVTPAIEESSENVAAPAPMAVAPMAVTPVEPAPMTNQQLASAASGTMPTAAVAASVVATTKTSKMDEGYGVQVASYSNRDEAIRGWRVLQKKLPVIFDGFVPHVNEKEVNGRAMYQLKVGPFVDKSYSSKFCSMLKEQNTDCLVTKYDGEAF
ncbi:SPOR domain-containing protein [Marinomonas transparens]|uniref:SPOR domain-containing protein n=1 Tax=Marinomonas transparens TaxID=2795388 RepID=A0A934JU44_9GAMM|nr:SPOR domain-containing protein [Marinomonas transparens]MBJ7537395.1 SPOR domain-containing protein [Marinomonas transparens]